MFLSFTDEKAKNWNVENMSYKDYSICIVKRSGNYKQNKSYIGTHVKLNALIRPAKQKCVLHYFVQRGSGKNVSLYPNPVF